MAQRSSRRLRAGLKGLRTTPRIESAIDPFTRAVFHIGKPNSDGAQSSKQVLDASKDPRDALASLSPSETEKTLAGRWLSTGLNAVSRRVVSVNPNPRGRAGGLLALSQRILWRPALTGSSMERRLAAILSADVVAYTRLIEADEVGTFERLKKLRLDHVEPLVSAHHGRIFKLTGDGALAEFPSATEAVQCAVKI